MKEYSKLAALISSEFSRYIMEHEDISEKIPLNALIVFQINGEEGFNKWSKEIAERNKEVNQSVIYVNVKKWRQKPSVEELEIITT